MPTSAMPLELDGMVHRELADRAVGGSSLTSRLNTKSYR
jgi:hypothetical protein